MTATVDEVERVELPWDSLPTDALKHLNRVAGRVAHKYGRISDPDDLASAAWVWIGDHPGRVKRWWYQEQGEPRFSYAFFRRDMTAVCTVVAKRDRAFALGYDPADDYTYAAGVIKTFLPYVWHSQILAAIQEVNEKSSTRADPSTGGNATALAMDVRRIYAVVIEAGSVADRILFAMYAGGLPQVAVAAQLGLEDSRVSVLHGQAIKALAFQLNGGDSLGPGLTWRDDRQGPRRNDDDEAQPE